MRRPTHRGHEYSVYPLLLALTSAACSAPETTMTIDNPSSSDADADAIAPASRYRQNPNPTQRYDITMILADAPGPFAVVEGSVSYDIAGQECLPPRDPFGGIQYAPKRASFPVTYTKVSENVYVGTLYADFMLDEDYYGRGVCRWQVGGTSVSLQATGAPAENVFVPSLFPDAILAGQAVTTYFLKSVYPRDHDADPAVADDPTISGYYSDFGQTDRSKWASYISDSDLFTITLTPKVVMP